MRTVVKSHEVAHLWAHQTQSSARTPGAMSFDGPDFYSYSTVIGSIVTGKDGRRAYLVSDESYSVTTSAHQSRMRQAISRDAVAFYVPGIGRGGCGFSDSVRIMDAWAERVKDLLEESARSRKPKNARLFADAAGLVERMREFSTFMGLKRVKLPTIPGTLAEVAAAVAAEDARKARAAARESKRRAVEFAKRIEDEKLRLAEWIAGGSRYPDAYSLPTALRVVGDTVETSRGASFPVAHALRGLALVDSVRARGEEWWTNGHTCHLGHYRIDRITPDGTVYAGCHVVPFDSIQRIRPALEAFLADSAHTDSLALA